METKTRGGEDTAYTLRINNAAVREYQIWKLGKLRSNRDDNEVREALNRLDRSATLSEDDDNDDNGINNRKNGKIATATLEGRGGRRLAPDGAIIPIIY